MNFVTQQPCPPHHWAHAPTIGYFSCTKCRERIDHSDPRYAEILSTYYATSYPKPTAKKAMAGSDLAEVGFALEQALDKILTANERANLARKFLAALKSSPRTAKDAQTIVCEYLAGDLDEWEAVEELIQTGLTAMEAERIIDEVCP